MVMKTVSLYSKADLAIEDIQDWFYAVFFVNLTRSQVVSYAIATVELQEINTMGAIAALVGIDETKSVAITEIAYKKLMGMKKRTSIK